MSPVYNAEELYQLRARAFARASAETIPDEGLELIFHKDYTHSEDVWLSEYIYAYRMPDSKNVALVWGLNDGARSSTGLTTKLREIPREDFDALQDGLERLQPVAEQPKGAADAGMMDSQPRLRDLYRSADTPGPNQERDAEALKKLREKIEAANEDFGWSDDGEINRRKQLFSLPILVLVVAMLGLGLFTANTRRDMWTFAVASAVLDIPSLTFLILTIARPKTQQGRVRSIWIAVLATVVIVAAGILLSLGRGL